MSAIYCILWEGCYKIVLSKQENEYEFPPAKAGGNMRENSLKKMIVQIRKESIQNKAD